MSAGGDSPERPTTPTEQAEYATLSGALFALSDYLHKMAPWGTLDEAVANRAPLATRTRGVVEDEFGAALTPLFVNPRTAWEWMQDQRRYDPVISPEMVTAAVTFMGGRIAVTVRGRDEHPGMRPSPHRGREVANWYRLSREMVLRLKFGPPDVPVLTPMPGRKAALSADSPAHRPSVAALRGGAWMAPNDVVRLLKAFLLDREPTTHVRVAIDESRPLVPRRPGRPRRAGAGLDLDAAVVSVEALRLFTMSDGGRLRVPGVGSDEAMRRAIEGAEEKLNGSARIVNRAAGVDVSRDVVRRRGWVRCTRSGVGLAPWDGDPLRSEVLAARTQRNAQ